MRKDKKQTIKCDVESCKYNNSEDRECELDEILVSCTCDYDDCRCTDETICDSFEEKDSDEEEYEYEEETSDSDDEEVEEELESEEYLETEEDE